jgi:PAS domain S-box-containing protein
MSIPGYQLTEVLQSDANVVIRRGIRESDRAPVLVKTIQAAYPSLDAIASFRYEYSLLRSLDLPGVTRVYALEELPQSPALILEDFGAVPLAQLIQQEPLDLPQFLTIGLQLAETLAQLHQARIIHKNLRSRNIWVHPVTSQVKIDDFSIATRLSYERQTSRSPQLLEGTLAYLSPEQSGRMNRLIDFRSDFYSLGVVFYEMLTGQLPFQAIDPLELVHCHIARTPTPPQLLNPDLPRAVADIVLKLLAKTAEDRYQNALGLKADLEICWQQLQTYGDVTPFLIGQLDHYSQFLIPQKLYGREAEVKLLLETFDRVGQTGRSELVLVSGYSGVGKSSLVSEIHKPMAQSARLATPGVRGYFIRGKFDQFKRNIPYAALVQALQDLLQQLLTEPDDRIAGWREALTVALGVNGQVIVDVIPELERIIGPQPPVPQLGPTDAQNRFNRVFQQFIQVFCQPAQPLVLFLDDLQWVDLASLHLIQLLLSDRDLQSLLLIGAYRDHEVSPVHPLMQTLEALETVDIPITNIVLQPLQPTHVSQLLQETLRTEAVQPFAELVHCKTQGNPFFLIQLLRSLHQEGLIWFDFASGCWQWHLDRLSTITITENVVELMVSQIQKLSASTQEVLKLAACVGDRFTLDVLSLVNQKSLSETALELWEALQVGLVLPLDQSYKVPLTLNETNGATPDSLPVPYRFLHDRVQQAAYTLIPEADRQQTHLKIGQLLLQQPSEREDVLFEVVNHLNIGSCLLTETAQRHELARLNLLAGQKAIAATAYEPATRYLRSGLSLLDAAAWEMEYDLALMLYTEATAAEFCTGHFAEAAMLAEVVLRQAKTVLDKVKVYETQIQFCISQNRLKDAIAIDLDVLRQMGITLRQTAPPVLTRQYPDSRTIAHLRQLPEMTDCHQLAAMRIFRAAAPPTYFADPDCFTAIIFTMVDYCLLHGNSALAAYAYACYGLILAGAMGEIEAGYESCLFALQLLERYDAKDVKAQVYEIFNGHVRHWKEPLSAVLADMLVGIQSGLEVGQMQYTAYIAAFYCSVVFFTGDSLENVAEKQDQAIELLDRLKTEISSDYGRIWRQLVANLRGRSPDWLELVGRYFNAGDRYNVMQAAGSRTSLFSLHLARGMLLYLQRNNAAAIAEFTAAELYIQSVMGMMNVSVHNFYTSLTLLALYPTTDSSAQPTLLQRVQKQQRSLQEFADHAPCNHLAKYQLVEAEKARVLGDWNRASEYYDQAIATARTQRNFSEEALANELAAEFYLQWGRNRLAKDYLTDAYYGYLRWGAIAKVDALTQRYPDLLAELNRSATTPAKTTQITVSASGSTLDLATVIKVSQLFTGEIIFDRLLNQLMSCLLENAGATSGALLLKQAEELMLVADTSIGQASAIVTPEQPLESCTHLAIPLIQYVARSQTPLVLNDATQEQLFVSDLYLSQRQPKSILCLPMIYQNALRGVLYLENNLAQGAFTSQHLELLSLLSAQIAISLENASLYRAAQTYLQQLEANNTQLTEMNASLAAEIHERQQIEAERDRFFTLSLDMLCIATFDGYFARLNPAWERTLGYTQAELTAQPYLEFVHPDDRERTIAEARTLRQGIETISFENRYRCKDGSYRWISWRVAPFPEQQLLYAVAHDITARKQAEAEQIRLAAEREQLLASERAARVEAERANRLKDEFLAVLSHELRTPLGPILGWAQFLRTRKVDAAATERALETIERNAKLQTQLIEDLLDVSRILQGKLSLTVYPVNLETVILQAIETVRLTATDKSIQILAELDPAAGQMVGDPNRLQQVLWNLLSNAIKFSPAQSQVTVRLTEQPRGWACITVSDAGKGISPEFLPYVFDRFRQADSSITRSYGGLGLGLAIAQHLVELHGGTIMASSPGEGQGATFSVRLPLMAVASTQAELGTAADAIAAEPLPLSGIRILLVDDEADMRDFIGFTLRQAGADITLAASATEALESLRQTQPDVLLSDIGMPELDGYALLQRIRALRPEAESLPVIALTAYASEDNRQQAQAAGFQQHLAKPVAPDALIAAILEVLP